MKIFYSICFVFLISAVGSTTALGMSFREAASGGNCSECAWISAEGDITSSTADEFRSFVKAHKIARTLVRLNSGGGSLIGGMALGRIIRDLQFDTAINTTTSEPNSVIDDWGPGYCASACAYAFLGGVHRSIEDDSKIGFHQFAMASGDTQAPDQTDITQRAIAATGMYVADMGAKPELVFLASAASPSDIIWLDRTMMEALNVVTDRKQISGTGWQIQPYRSGVMAQERQQQLDGTTTVFSIVCDHSLSNSYLFNLVRRFDEAPMDLRNDIAKDIRTIAFTNANKRLTADLTVATVVSDDLYVATTAINFEILSQLAFIKTPIEIDLGVSHAYMSYVGGWTQEMSVTGLPVALDIVSRNCSN